MSDFIPVFFGFSAFLCANALIGPLSSAVNLFLWLCSCIIIVFWAYRVSKRSYVWRISLLSPLLFPVLMAIFPDEKNLIGKLGVLVVLYICAYMCKQSHKAILMARLARSLALVEVVMQIAQYFPSLWRTLDAISQMISWLAGKVAQHSLEMGPTHTFLWMALFFIFLVIPNEISKIKWDNYLKPLLVFLIKIFGIIVISVAFLPLLASLVAFSVKSILFLPESHTFTFDPETIYCLVFILPFCLILSCMPKFLLDGKTHIKQVQKWPLITASALILCFGYLLTEKSIPEITKKPTIAFLDQGQMNWETPIHGKYGFVNGGMFGMMLKYLENSGYNAVIHSKPLTELDFDKVSIVVIINPRKKFSVSEYNLLWKYVKQGGGLLVLGDHTDIWGTQKPLNYLLSPTGIKFKFDSAFPLRKYWSSCQKFLAHPITDGLVDQQDTQIGVGASLKLENNNARPVIVGRYAFSDFGNRANTGTGGLLGDYRYQYGERFGDVVLVAQAHYGAGKVIVFGDTSSFQSIALATSYHFTMRIFKYLSSKQKRSTSLVAIYFLALIGAIWLFIWSKPEKATILFAILLLSAELLGHNLSGTSALPEKTAVLATTHTSRFSTQHFNKDSIGAVLFGLYRSGYLPLLTPRNFAIKDLVTAKLIVYIAPTQKFSSGEIQTLTKFVQNGGTLIIAGGEPDKTTANQLLAIGKMQLSYHPLGSIKIKRGNSNLQFVNAWSIVHDSSQKLMVHAKWKNHIVVAEAKIGSGRVVAIGDAYFLLDDNLEGEFEFHLGNVKLLADILK